LKRGSGYEIIDFVTIFSKFWDINICAFVITDKRLIIIRLDTAKGIAVKISIVKPKKTVEQQRILEIIW